MMLEREQRVEAQRLGEIAHRQMIGHDRHIGTAGLGQHIERNADFHCCLLLSNIVAPAKAGAQG